MAMHLNTNPDQPWIEAPLDLSLGGDEVHVWRAGLESATSSISSLASLLSEDEVLRAKRFYFEKDRNQFVATRSLLRILLGRYLQVSPEGIRFGYGTHGKPFLQEDAESHIRFNVSHSHHVALLAFAGHREVGVDAEFLRPERSTDDLAERFFSPLEVAALRALPKELWLGGFFSCWTRKEAFIKALGEGLSFPLSSFAVSVDPREPARLLETQLDPDAASRWHIENLNVGSDYRGALAIEYASTGIRTWEWNWRDIRFQAGMAHRSLDR
jgi:4'-phosphopantetheinyl transferase